MSDAFGTSNNMQRALQKELQRKRVLIVDRHPHARDSLRMMLSTLGVTQVHGAGTAAEVVRQVKAHRFDIILSDYYLDDGRDGQQLLEELRYGNLIPVGTVYLVITSERTYHNVVSVAELSPDSYLIRPFTGEQLQIRLMRSVYKKHALRQIYTAIEKQSYFDAIQACDRAAKRHPPYILDILRLKGELLSSLGRSAEAEEVYRQVLTHKSIPWAKMGLATALRDRGALEEAAVLAQQLTEDAKEYLAAYDFLAGVYEHMGKLEEAQKVLETAAALSPNNSVRQRVVGDIATRNKDLDVAAAAYARVLERQKASTISTIDDYANLTRVLLETKQVDAARKVQDELKRNWRGNPHGEFAALVGESLCLQKENKTDKAKQSIAQALSVFSAMADELPEGQSLSPRIALDLGDACLQANMQPQAEALLRRVAAENHDNERLMSQVFGVFEKYGQGPQGRNLLDEVGAEIVRLNNRGVLAAREGNLAGSVQMLVEAANKVPNVQFLCNAAKAIFTLLDKQGWDAAQAEQAMRFLQRAQAKDPKNPKVSATRELYTTVARKYGIGSSESQVNTQA